MGGVRFILLAAVLLAVVSSSCVSANRRLVLAANDGDVEGVASALKGEGIDFSKEEALRNYGAMTPMVATIFGDGGRGGEIARLLLAAGADPNEVADGYPVLTYAIRQEKWSIALALLEYGADPHALDRDGDTPLENHIAGNERCSFLKVPEAAAILDALLAAGRHPDPEKNHQTPAMFSAIRCADLVLVRRIIGAGADIHEKVGGRTALLYAAEWGSLDIVEFLVEAGADLGVTDEKRRDTCTLLNLRFDRPENREKATAPLRAAGVDCPAWDQERIAAYYQRLYDEAQAARARQAEERRASAQANFSWEGMQRERAEAEAKAAAAAAKAAARERERSIFNITRDTSSYDNARACPSGGTYCGSYCCGTGMICCVPEGSSSRAGGVCKVAQAGRGCWWGTQQAR